MDEPAATAAWQADPPAILRAAGFEPDPWQAELLTERAPETLMCCSRQAGKALSLDTPLATSNGWTTMGDVQVGHVLFDETGAPCQVLSCSPITHRPVYRVTFSDGSVIDADGEHLWTTLDAAARGALSRSGVSIPDCWHAWESKGKPPARGPRLGEKACSYPGCEAAVAAKSLCIGHFQQVKYRGVLMAKRNPRPKAKTITTNQMAATLSYCARGDLNHSIPAQKGLRLPEADLPIDPYVLGAWLGDGHSAAARITTADPEILQEIAKAGEPIGPSFAQRGLARVYSIGKRGGLGVCKRGHPAKYNKRGTHCRTCENDRDLAKRKGLTPPPQTVFSLHERLRSLGVLGDKHIPDIYLRASFGQRMALLQGLMDTDGSATSARTSVCEFCTTNKRLAAGFAELAVSLGLIIRSKESRAVLNGRDCGPRWRIYFSPTIQPFRLPRKASRISFDGARFCRRQLRYVKQIELIGEMPVRCISVDSSSRLYLAGRSMIPTHNSTVAAALAVHAALEEYPALVLLLSPSLRQSKELFVKVKDIYRAIGSPVASVRSRPNVLDMELVNGSRIVSLPGNEETIRGFSSVRLLIVDEAARVPDALYRSVRPMLAVSRGRLICMSTPFGRAGWFFDAWHDPSCPWRRVKVTADQVPRITPEFLEQERRSIGERWWRQEYQCQFLEMVGACFRGEDVDAITSVPVQAMEFPA